MSQLKQREQIQPSLFYSDLNRLDGANSYWRESSTLLSLLIPVLISFGKPSPHPETMLIQISGHALARSS